MLIAQAASPHAALWTLLSFGGFTLLLFLIGRLITRQRRNRTRIYHVAREMKLDFHSEIRDENNEKLGMSIYFSLFSYGQPLYFENVFQGANDQVEMTVFDYTNTVGGGLTGRLPLSPERQTVSFFKISGMNLPKFQLKPNGLVGSLGEMLGFEDINFKYYPRFSSLFSLKGPNENAVREFFNHDTLLHYFEHHPDLWIEGQGNKLICYRSGHRVKPRAMEKFIQQGCQLAHLFAFKTVETDSAKLIPHGRKLVTRVRVKLAKWRL